MARERTVGQRPFRIPPILFEGDESGAPAPAMGPGEKYALGPAAPAGHFDGRSRPVARGLWHADPAPDRAGCRTGFMRIGTSLEKSNANTARWPWVSIWSCAFTSALFQAPRRLKSIFIPIPGIGLSMCRAPKPNMWRSWATLCRRPVAEACHFPSRRHSAGYRVARQPSAVCHF